MRVLLILKYLIMKVLKTVLMAVLFVATIAMTSCTTTDIAEEDQLNETHTVVLSKVHRPGSGGN